MPDPVAALVTDPDARSQAPFEVGDYVTYAGTLVTDVVLQPTVGPYTPLITTYISAHTVTNNIALYTAPGADPAYVSIDVSLPSGLAGSPPPAWPRRPSGPGSRA